MRERIKFFDAYDMKIKLIFTQLREMSFRVNKKNSVKANSFFFFNLNEKKTEPLKDHFVVFFSVCQDLCHYRVKMKLVEYQISRNRKNKTYFQRVQK